MPRPYAALKAFLADPRRPKNTLRYYELQGFLFTIAGAPELVRPSEWMPVIFANGSAGYETLEEARAERQLMVRAQPKVAQRAVPGWQRPWTDRVSFVWTDRVSSIDRQSSVSLDRPASVPSDPD